MKVDGLQHTALFGPVESRRYGVSLGVNLLPGHYKICSFDCPYCECGPTDRITSAEIPKRLFPNGGDVVAALRNRLEQDRDSNRTIDAITLAGNGEPTLHPDFGQIMEAMGRVRDAWVPSARIIVLTNGTTLDRDPVREGLMVADERIIKVDAATDEMMARMNCPVGRQRIQDLIEGLDRLPTFFTQTMFVDGVVNNADDAHVAQWILLMGAIRPAQAQIYSTDRLPADTRVRPVSRERLDRIASRLIDSAGVPVTVYS